MLKFTDDLPEEFLKTREEMEEEIAQDFKDGEITYSELCEELQMIEDMFNGDYSV